MARSAPPRPRALAPTLVALALLAGAPAAAADEGEQQPAAPGDMSVEQAWQAAKQDWQKLQQATGEEYRAAKEAFQESWSALREKMAGMGEDAVPPPDPSAEGEQD